MARSKKAPATKVALPKVDTEAFSSFMRRAATFLQAQGSAVAFLLSLLFEMAETKEHKSKSWGDVVSLLSKRGAREAEALLAGLGVDVSKIGVTSADKRAALRAYKGRNAEQVQSIGRAAGVWNVQCVNVRKIVAAWEAGNVSTAMLDNIMNGEHGAVAEALRAAGGTGRGKDMSKGAVIKRLQGAIKDALKLRGGQTVTRDIIVTTLRESHADLLAAIVAAAK